MTGQKVDIKIVLLGKSYAGKTCLVERYLHGRYSGDTVPYQNTIGAAFGAKKVKVGKKQLVLGIWDTAGSERYEAMSRIYYRGAVAAVLCYDLTDKSSFDRARFWVGELRLTEESCKIYLCGTKKDIVEGNPDLKRVDRRQAEALGQDLQAEVFETSSKTGENVERIFQKIAEDYSLNFDERKRDGGFEDSFHITDTHQPRNRWKSCFLQNLMNVLEMTKPNFIFSSAKATRYLILLSGSIDKNLVFLHKVEAESVGENRSGAVKIEVEYVPLHHHSSHTEEETTQMEEVLRHRHSNHTEGETTAVMVVGDRDLPIDTDNLGERCAIPDQNSLNAVDVETGIHRPRQCPAFDKYCGHCNMKGHFRRMCGRRNVDHYDEHASADEYGYGNMYHNDYDDCASANAYSCENVYHHDEGVSGYKYEYVDEATARISNMNVWSNEISDNSSEKVKWQKQIEIRGSGSMSFKLYTGAEISIIRKDQYDRMPHKPQLLRGRAAIIGISKIPVTPVGKVMLLCLVNNHEYIVKCGVLNEYVPTLLCLSDMLRMDLVRRVDRARVTGEQKPVEVQESVKSILEENNDVFEGTGKVPGRVTLKVNESVQPVAHPARPVPAASRDKVREKLESLEAEEIIEKVPIEPLQGLIKESNQPGFKWHFDQVHKEVFGRIKRGAQNSAVLQYYSRTDPVVIQCDASRSGLGFVLMQKGNPVHYGSRALTTTEQAYTQIEKELLAIVFAVGKFHTHIYGL
ncbi:hypothetical protein ScPMuIL_005476 [Solemya velum]